MGELNLSPLEKRGIRKNGTCLVLRYLLRNFVAQRVFNQLKISVYSVRDQN